jgi:hypothetical protein
VSALVDSGSPISLIKSHIVKASDRKSFRNYIFISGINKSQLNIEAVSRYYVMLSLVD